MNNPETQTTLSR